jgi:hypothetical protein
MRLLNSTVAVSDTTYHVVENDLLEFRCQLYDISIFRWQMKECGLQFRARLKMVSQLSSTSTTIFPILLPFVTSPAARCYEPLQAEIPELCMLVISQKFTAVTFVLLSTILVALYFFLDEYS